MTLATIDWSEVAEDQHTCAKPSRSLGRRFTIPGEVTQVDEGEPWRATTTLWRLVTRVTSYELRLQLQLLSIS